VQSGHSSGSKQRGRTREIIQLNKNSGVKSEEEAVRRWPVAPHTPGFRFRYGLYEIPRINVWAFPGGRGRSTVAEIKKTAAQKQSPKKKLENRFREPMQHFGLAR